MRLTQYTLGASRLAFGICIVLVFFALGWISATMLKLESSVYAARRQFNHEHNIRLVLWHMEAELIQWLAGENNQPHFAYTSFHTAARPHNSLLRAPREGEALARSPFLQSSSKLIYLHFFITPSGYITSPEVPPPGWGEAATGIAGPAAARFATLCKNHDGTNFQGAILIGQNQARQKYTQPIALTLPAVQAPQSPFVLPPPSEIFKQTGSTFRQVDRANEPVNLPIENDSDSGILSYTGRISPFYPVWLDGELYLLRSVDTVGQSDCIQGIWLNWPVLRDALLTHASGRLPGASLRPPSGIMLDTDSPDTQIKLATLPLTLVVKPPLPGETVPLFSDARIPLIACWLFAALAMVGIGALFLGAVSLSERRASFVSAVTHELRTPLTTFQLYTEMLAGGMVSEDSRKSYVETLHTEAQRLKHLVENVLGFARLEKGRDLRRMDMLTVSEIVARIEQRVRDRLEKDGMALEVDVPGKTGEILLRTDGTAIEQILFNLADNAAKYAAGPEGKARLHVSAETDDEYARFEFSDNGPGIPASALKNLFQAFSRSAEEAAGNKPGVGLGLAFSKELARRLGGDLELLRTGPNGCAFELRLPIAEEGE
ncbi:MAG: HAMP domain-containing histidine kinase [Puniceicoccales bacterium]|nr:HAMP domain-containing histidine kinase [Puniceicoccales bacterium]